MGRMLHHILEEMEDAGATAAAPPRLLLYSGHDWTVMPLLMALDPSYGRQSGQETAFEDAFHWTPYSGDLALEVHQDQATGERFVRVLYGGVTPNPNPNPNANANPNPR